MYLNGHQFSDLLIRLGKLDKFLFSVRGEEFSISHKP